MIINLFCDASIDSQNTNIACSGCVVVMQDDRNAINIINKRFAIKHNSTNNSAEILAILLGVSEALRIRNNLYPNAIFRLFSDSGISLFGLRDWMVNWIRNMGDDNILRTSQKDPVINQQTFINIYNLIVNYNLKIELYHQKGHIAMTDKALKEARAYFIKQNKVTPDMLGLSIENIVSFNNMVDNDTRIVEKTYIESGMYDETTTTLIRENHVNPITYIPKKEMLARYVQNINKTSVLDKSRHNFNGGYNQ